MTAPQATTQVAAEADRIFDADTCERIFHAALGDGDTTGVEAALVLLAVRDPYRAQQLMDSTRLALDLLDSTPTTTRRSPDDRTGRRDA